MEALARPRSCVAAANAKAAHVTIAALARRVPTSPGSAARVRRRRLALRDTAGSKREKWFKETKYV